MSHSDTGGREHSRRPLELDPVERVQTTNPLLAEDERQKTREQVEADDSNSSIVVEHAPTSQTYVHDQGRTFFDAGFSAWAFVDSVRNAVPGTKPLQVLSRRETTAYRHYIADATTPEIPQGLGNFRTGLLAALPPHDVLRFLSATFFRYCQSNYFWLHPAIYTRKLDAFLAGTHEFSAEYAESKKRPVEFVCVLFMVLALGSQFAALEQDDEDDASAVPSPTEVYRDASIATMDPLQIKTPTPKASPGWRFYLVSQRLLTDVVTSCSMTSIQACGLQGQFLAPTTAHDAAYNVIGVAVRMCVNMGLHRSFGGDKLHPHVRELRNRLWWSVYLLDRFFGFWMGRPTMVDDNDINTPFPEDLAELKMEQPTGSVEGQIALVRVSRIMQSIVKKIYPNLKSSSETPLVINIDAFLDLQSQLDEWKAQLPPSLRLSPTSTRGSVHLHLGQQHAVMLLTRTALSQVAATKSSTMAGTQQGSEYKAQFLHNAAMSCVRAASNTIHMLQSLRDRKLLCRYSCQDPLFCTAALCVLLLGVKIQSPDADMKKVIIQGVSILQKLGEGSETAASSLAGIVKGFQPYFQPSGQTTSSRPIRMEPSLMVDRGQGHKAWESWMQQSPGTAESMLSTNQVDDDACQAANVVSIQNMLQVCNLLLCHNG